MATPAPESTLHAQRRQAEENIMVGEETQDIVLHILAFIVIQNDCLLANGNINDWWLEKYEQLRHSKAARDEERVAEWVVGRSKSADILVLDFMKSIDAQLPGGPDLF